MLYRLFSECFAQWECALPRQHCRWFLCVKLLTVAIMEDGCSKHSWPMRRQLHIVSRLPPKFFNGASGKFKVWYLARLTLLSSVQIAAREKAGWICGSEQNAWLNMDPFGWLLRFEPLYSASRSSCSSQYRRLASTFRWFTRNSAGLPHITENFTKHHLYICVISGTRTTSRSMHPCR